MAPKELEFEIYNDIGALPHFNDPEFVPEKVTEFCNRIKRSDAVLICTPEYAFGIPGSLKNALDWTVGSSEFVNKPVALITASSQGEKGHAALLLVLEAISAKVIEEGSILISFVRSKLDEKGKIKDQNLEQNLRKALKALVENA